jgi:putative peptidoglycan lipid II flippase
MHERGDISHTRVVDPAVVLPRLPDGARMTEHRPLMHERGNTGPLASLAGAAVLVAGVTVLARAVGFGRWIVFAHTVHGGCLADVYNTANLLPNVLFEVVAGGALAGVVVPVLAGPIARADRTAVERTVSALLTRALVLLLPVTLLAAAAARPLMRFFLGGHGQCTDAAVDVGTRMLLIFLPQLFCYAIAVVLAGTLQAHHRFLAAALAPLVSSLVVIGTYVLFRHLAHGAVGLEVVPHRARTALAVGTTLGVLALALSVLVPVVGAGLRLRPRWSFDAGVAPRVRALALAGVAALVAQQLNLLVVSWLANHHGRPGALTAYTWAYAVFLLPYAVLAVPIATSAFPRIAAALAQQQEPAAPPIAGSTHPARDERAAAGARLIAGTTRAVLAVSALGAAVTAAAAVPVSRMFAAGVANTDDRVLAGGIVALAPGLLGWGLVAHLSRVLYAAHRGRRAAVAVVGGWAVAAGGNVVLITATPNRDAVAALGAGTSIGLSLAGALLLRAVVRSCGAAALHGLARTAAAGIGAALLAGPVGYALGRQFDDTGAAGAALAAVAVAAISAVLFLAVLAVGDRGVLAYLARRPRGPDRVGAAA